MKLRKKKLKKGIYIKHKILDVAALNTARKRLVGACKTTIYVEEAEPQHDSIWWNLNVFEAVEWTHQRNRPL